MTLKFDFVQPESDRKITVTHSDGNVYEFDGLADLQKSDKFPMLLADAAAEKIFSVDFGALIFIDKPNLRSWRPEAGDLGGMASRSPGTVDMKLDHSNSQDARIGFVSNVREVSVTNLGAETKGLAATMKIRSGKHQCQFFKGTLDKWSIGASGSAAKCSTCAAAYKKNGPKEEPWFYPSCGHYPGEKPEAGGDVTEMILVGARINETSAVGKPAVSGVKNYVGRGLSADADDAEPEIPTELDSMEKELQDKIKALETELAAQKEVAQKATEFATKLAGDELVRQLRVTKADLKSAKVVKLITVLGVEDAFETIKEWPARPELAPKSELSAETGDDPATEDGTETNAGIVDDDAQTLSAAIRGAKPKTEPKRLLERLIEKGDIKAKK